MGDFGFYLREGFYHITDWKGYDHILFVLALCLPYPAKNWRQVLILITAFTIGHSITLALSVFNRILISSSWIEFLIPVTILITALENVRRNNTDQTQNRWRYGSALLFGLIHGMGFSNYLKSMLGKDESIITQLLAFNVGLELGQLLIVVAVFLITFVFVQLLNFKRSNWTLFVSGGIFGISLIMALERLPF
ncbi:HupE/UreJ family protein [Lacibacter sp. H407]|uniref:HupE/UreJ family protein n=1 Tax=Lacibacter sp. H407 TaxID=3133423 RepID=UPI0030C60E77